MTRIHHGDLFESQARVCLFAAAGNDADIMTSIRHQARVMTDDTFHPSHDRRGGVMQENDFHFLIDFRPERRAKRKSPAPDNRGDVRSP